MLITVMYNNGSNGLVPASALEFLIEEHEVVAFWRSNGFVRVGRDPLRKRPRPGNEPGERTADNGLHEPVLHPYRHIYLVK